MKSKEHQRGFLYRNGLSIAVGTLFLLFWAAQAITGWFEFNSQMQDQRAPSVAFLDYLSTGHFMEVTFENWESEFLQMFLYVLLTVWLRQKGSSESKSLDEKEEVDRTPQAHADAPWPVRKGGIALAIYKNSLSIAFFILFLMSFALHAVGSYRDYALQEALRQRVPKDMVGFLGEARFWFESFQNWQSEFLAIAAIVLLSIHLRQFGSPESKPVDAPHHETGK
jgi:hypothetical protein